MKRDANANPPKHLASATMCNAVKTQAKNSLELQISCSFERAGRCLIMSQSVLQPAMIAPSAPIQRIDIALIISLLFIKEAGTHRVKLYPKQIATNLLRFVSKSSQRIS
jgi:hypothetical protein